MADGRGKIVQTDPELHQLPLPQLVESRYVCSEELAYLTDDALFAATSTRIAFTGNVGGVSSAPYESLNLSYTVGDDAALVDANRMLALEAIGAGGASQRLVSPLQVHGVKVVTVHDVATAQEEAAAGADAVVCAKAETPVLLCFADCTPVVCVAPNGAFMVAHAGWRGALGGIPGIALGALAAEAGCEPSQCNCYIGPHIGACCYETSEEILSQFVSKFGAGCDAGKRHLDLSFAVAVSLEDAGADSRRIIDAGICTKCHADTYYSYRASGGVCGRQGALAFRKE